MLFSLIPHWRKLGSGKSPSTRGAAHAVETHGVPSPCRQGFSGIASKGTVGTSSPKTYNVSQLAATLPRKDAVAVSHSYKTILPVLLHVFFAARRTTSPRFAFNLHIACLEPSSEGQLKAPLDSPKRDFFPKPRLAGLG